MISLKIFFVFRACEKNAANLALIKTVVSKQQNTEFLGTPYKNSARFAESGQNLGFFSKFNIFFAYFLAKNIYFRMLLPTHK